MDWGSQITRIAETTLKEKKVVFGIKDLDRLEHLSVIGRAGTDRSEFLARMVLEDMDRGLGVVLLDTTGKLTRLVNERISNEARDRLIYLDPADGEYPYAWNAVDDFRAIEPDIAKPLVARALASIYQIPISSLTDVTASVLLDKKDSTFLLLYDLVMDDAFRVAAFADTPGIVETFSAALIENVESVEKIKEHGRYVAKDSLVRNLLGQMTSKFTLGKLSEGAAFIIDLSRLKMFPTRVTPLIRLFIHATEARAHAQSEPIALYLNDCLRYLGEDDVELIFKKHAVITCISDTFYGDEHKELREKTVSRSGSVVAFAPNQGDVATIERVFYPYITADELAKIEEGEFIITLTIDAVRSRPFFARVLPLRPRSGLSEQDLMSASRDRYTAPRLKVDLLFKKPLPGKGKGKEGEPGNFSDAFRSIFSKRTPPDLLQKKTETTTPPPVPNVTKPAEPKEPQGEVSEQELRAMLNLNSKKGHKDT